MIRRALASSALAVLLVACAEEPAPVAPPPPPPSAAPPPVASVATPADTSPPPPPEPTPEEKKKADDAARLQAARAKWEDDDKAEIARWTPEMHAAAKALADRAYTTGKAGVEAAMKGTHRVPGAADRDKYRHPADTMAFFGLKPTTIALDIGPGEGWYTELLAPTLARQGKYIATTADPMGPIDSPSTFGAQRFAAFLGKAPELYGDVKTVIVDNKAPKLDLDGKLDMVLSVREMHNWVNGGTLDAWLAEIQRSLKPGGVFALIDHRAAPDADPKESAKKGYLPEKWVIATVEAAGFKLAGKSEINANPKDTKDYEKGVWTLPPSFVLKDQDHDKYAAIGESDRMTLKFVKGASKAAPAKAQTPAPATK
jgi:predicted methyltransferase